MHATERLRNVSRTVLVYLAGLSLGGATLVAADDVVFNSSTAPLFVRVRVEATSAQNAHRLSGDPAELATFQVVAECYARTGEGEPLGSVDAAEGAAEEVMAALRAKSLPLLDYVTDPTGATPVTGYVVRFTVPPTLTSSPPLDGWARRIVVAPGWWQLRHTG